METVLNLLLAYLTSGAAEVDDAEISNAEIVDGKIFVNVDGEYVAITAETF